MNFRRKESGDLRRPARLDFLCVCVCVCVCVCLVYSVVQILLQIGLRAMPAPGFIREIRLKRESFDMTSLQPVSPHDALSSIVETRKEAEQ